LAKGQDPIENTRAGPALQDEDEGHDFDKTPSYSDCRLPSRC
jgi:hypothetical protein